MLPSLIAAGADRLGRLVSALVPVGMGSRLSGKRGAGRRQPGEVVAGKLAGAAGRCPHRPERHEPRPGAARADRRRRACRRAASLAPEALLERAARRRRAADQAALPDALDLLAVGVAAGRPDRVLDEIAAVDRWPACLRALDRPGRARVRRPHRDAMSALAHRVPGPELGALAAALERSRRFGSPLADELHDQATALRRDASSALAERAARAAPKIQLVVALLLVPSVLLMLAAALVANAGSIVPSA